VSATPRRKKVRPLVGQPPRCKAHSSQTGLPCNNPPIRGGTVCRMHGGSTPAVRAAAQRRLANSADRMAALLLKIAEDKAVPHAVRLAAVKDALDRAGLTAKTAIEVELKPWEGLVTSIISERPADGEVVDAVVLEDASDDEDPAEARAALPPPPTSARPPRPGAGRPRSVKAQW